MWSLSWERHGSRQGRHNVGAEGWLTTLHLLSENRCNRQYGWAINLTACPQRLIFFSQWFYNLPQIVPSAGTKCFNTEDHREHLTSNHNTALVVSHFTGWTMIEWLEPSEKVSRGHLDSWVLNLMLRCWTFLSKRIFPSCECLVYLSQGVSSTTSMCVWKWEGKNGQCRMVNFLEYYKGSSGAIIQ